jgi:hypothetical protein
MFLNKIGFEHFEYNINNQDFGFVTNGIKCVVDGCSEGHSSEVGVKLFCEFFKDGCTPVTEVFDKLFALLDKTSNHIKNYLCFTILSVFESEDLFSVYYCGDGYIIKQKINDEIEFEKLDDGEFPKYFAYNYLSPEHLTYYKDGVTMNIKTFSKAEYKNIGVATDGLRYIFGKEYENEFIYYLHNGKLSALKRLINREHKHFKDDITIAF